MEFIKRCIRNFLIGCGWYDTSDIVDISDPSVMEPVGEKTSGEQRGSTNISIRDLLGNQKNLVAVADNIQKNKKDYDEYEQEQARKAKSAKPESLFSLLKHFSFSFRCFRPGVWVGTPSAAPSQASGHQPKR